jgi:steroid delta-isomerase-like uncharacterized protein
MNAENVELAVRYAQAWADHDPDAIVAMHTEDTVFHTHGMGKPVVGAPAMRDALAALFAQSPDLAFERKTAYFGDDHIVTEYVVSATVDGVHAACDGCDVFQIRDGRMARKDTYLDLAAYQRQLGVDLAVFQATSA